jgi:prolyl oligopeptidase
MLMNHKLFLSLPLFILTLAHAQKTNPAPSHSVTEEFFGTKITDEYRNLEDLDHPSTKEWMKSQTEYTHTVLNKIPKRRYYLEKRVELDKKQGYSLSQI